MKPAALLACVLVLCSSLALAQGRAWPKPPAPAETTSAPKPMPDSKIRVDTVQLQREARELSDLAGSLPADIERVNHGLFPKDTIDKLKRIEKLSKHLRGEISP